MSGRVKGVERLESLGFRIEGLLSLRFGARSFQASNDLGKNLG